MSQESPTLEETLADLGLSPQEAHSLLWSARIPSDRVSLEAHEVKRLEQSVSALAARLIGRDWRRADGADRSASPEPLGQYDLFHKQTGQHLPLQTFGDLLRWSEAEYGWQGTSPR